MYLNKLEGIELHITHVSWVVILFVSQSVN